MEIKQLRYFVAVARSENINRAAETLNLAQSALSRHIQALEQDLTITLFARNGKTIRLSGDGAMFLERALEVLKVVDDATLFAHSLSAGRIGRLQIGFRQVVGRQMVVPQACRQFRQENAAAKLELVAISTFRQVAAIKRAEIDAGFIHIYEGVDKTLKLRPVLRERWLLALPQSHRLARAKRIRLEDLVDEPFLAVKPTRSPILLGRLAEEMDKAGFRPRVIQEVQEGTVMLDLVSIGMGVGFILGGGHQPAGVVFREVDDFPLSHDLCLCWDPRRETPLLSRFIDVVTRCAERDLRERALA